MHVGVQSEASRREGKDISWIVTHHLPFCIALTSPIGVKASSPSSIYKENATTCWHYALALR